jgi:hypothetical protein
MDITALYYTANFINDFTGSVIRDSLMKAIGDIPLISISQKPLDFGTNICVGDIGRSQVNIYKQVLIGAKAANTKYVALCEDDVLYTHSHFRDFRPADDEFSYNVNRWGLYTWHKPPIFSYKDRIVLNQCIAPRDLVIEALEERFHKFPDSDKIPLRDFAEFGKYEKYLGVKVQKTVKFRSAYPCIEFSHKEALGFEALGTRKRKGINPTDTLDYWGSAQDVFNMCFKE